MGINRQQAELSQFNSEEPHRIALYRTDIYANLSKVKAVQLTRRPFTLRPHATLGTWTTDDTHFYLGAKSHLAELVDIAARVKAEWPVEAIGEVINGGDYPALVNLTKKHDLLSATVKIFAAMAVEAFLNFYGVVRLGRSAFDGRFEVPSDEYFVDPVA
ncbi:hypothetical protein [Burkholderia sp. LMU1-1-1.1]|uniref:hypothetical protein n=1 Tax=Burkholderia sp. LMU1-1-1.1 TaxID=3135266 RepID=UPI00343E4A9D